MKQKEKLSEGVWERLGGKQIGKKKEGECERERNNVETKGKRDRQGETEEK